ncbi:unnamed protein product [Caenorhabditis bovis]|uniref:Uncharacterized protein n=1 Tax=Caenorhabditis bovis TaxID=2654633 RepID=A0A8S1F069_9PELO|nr:unnamed protein product [Caenorhabditis bovis]CAB3407343.1 unnamed protein product [Caenorhabditis bovis]CAB3407344.1 unnamed protein product [Caenorhabditis bovis]
MKFVFAILLAIVGIAQACIGGAGGNQCCPPAQPACGNPCGGGAAPLSSGPVASYALPPAPGGYAAPPPPPPPPAPQGYAQVGK